MAQRQPRGTRRRWLGVVLGALAVLIVAEVTVRAVEPRLPEPPHWFSPSAARLVREMDAARADGRRGGLTVAGSSMAGRGLIPSVLASGTREGTPAHNVALGGGGQTTLQERWLLEEVVPRTRPDSVVWGLSSLDFNAARRPETIDRYDRARATRHGPFAAADRTLAEVSALAEHRSSLRDPYLMSQILTGADRGSGLPVRTTDRAITFEHREPPLPPARLEAMRRRQVAYAREVQLREYSVGRAELDAFRRTLRGLRRDDIRTAVVLMPVTQQFIDAHPRGARDFTRWKRAVRRIARDERVLLLDATRSMPVSAFRDLEHLDRAGARAFSAQLHDELVATGW